MPSLFEVMSALAPHGHRTWRADDIDQLDAIISESRISPENGAWSISFCGDAPCGYSLIEPELNIKRVVIGCAVTESHEEVHPIVLSDAVARAQDLIEDSETELHIAVQEHEPSYVTENVVAAGFQPVREFLKMRSTSDAMLADLEDPPTTAEVDIRRLQLDSTTEIAALTRLHNECFTGSWGFSPNSVAEIEERVNNDFERTGVPPILAAWDTHATDPTAYVWTTMHEKDGRIEMIGVTPELRGSGKGRLIFDAGILHLAEHGANTISLEVDAQNTAAVTMYGRSGLEVYSRTLFYRFAP